jgi:hypothetical protein
LGGGNFLGHSFFLERRSKELKLKPVAKNKAVLSFSVCLLSRIAAFAEWPIRLVHPEMADSGSNKAAGKS